MADSGLASWPALDIERRAAAASRNDLDDRLALAFDDLAVIAIEAERDGHWRAYFGTTGARDTALTALRDGLGAMITVTPIDVPDEGWAVKVQSTLGAIRVGGLIVAPPWDVVADEQGHRGTGAEEQGAFAEQEDRGKKTPVEGHAPSCPGAGHVQGHKGTGAETAAGPLVIVIEPSMGFGTGHHQSTRLCLRLLQQQDLADRTVLDVGTGSGVLAIAAARLGAARVTAIDNDPDAVTAARSNAARNAVAHLVDVRLEDLGTLANPGALRADVVVANLTANVIRRLREPLVQVVGREGCLVASGFTYDQVDLVREALEPLTQVSREDEDDWVALVLR